jgi:tRNA threonylcarbamoyladenosine biosynthesis protein TsaE
VSDSAIQTARIGAVVAQHALSGDVVALVGPLGAGKTQFVAGMADGLGIDTARVSSPTFVLMHEYAPTGGKTVLVHIDAYRITSAADLESIGWEHGGGELTDDAVVVVEWADRIADELGDDHLRIELEHVGEQARRITLIARGRWVDRVAKLCGDLERLRGNDNSETSASKRTGRCPTCQGDVRSDDPFFPFCGERCKTIDLGKWLKGNYVISRPLDQRDLEETE